MKNKIAINKDDFSWGGIHPFTYHPVIFHLIPDLKGKVVVDCGCGKGIWGFLIRAVRDVSGSKLLGIDLDSHYLQFCKFHRVYDTFKKSSITKLPVKDSSVDFLICSEVIEHLTEERW